MSEGCDHCYADELSRRLLKNIYTGKPPVVDTATNREDPFAVRLWPERLSQPSRWRGKRLIFVNSMSDLFHVDVPAAFVREVFKVMLDVDRHTYQILTKRPARASKFFRDEMGRLGLDGLPRHIWIGTSVENQKHAYRVRHLKGIPAAVRFVSCEPLIGPVSLRSELRSGDIHWLIAGGESGPVHRRMRPLWATNLRDECLTLGVPFFFKQWGGRTPKSGGRTLEGREWSQMPRGYGLGETRGGGRE